MPVAGILVQPVPKAPRGAATGDPLAGLCTAAPGPGDAVPVDPQPTAASPAQATMAAAMLRDLMTPFPAHVYEQY